MTGFVYGRKAARAPRRRYLHAVRRDLLPLLALFAAVLLGGRTVNPKPVDENVGQFVEITSTRELQPAFLEWSYDEKVKACYRPLFESDLSEGGDLSGDEYAHFVHILSNEYFDVQKFTDLPLLFQMKYLHLACMCERFDHGEECCQDNNAGINITGAGPDEFLTSLQDEYLLTVCFETKGAIDFARGSAAPTPTPTFTPTYVPTEQSRWDKRVAGSKATTLMAPTNMILIFGVIFGVSFIL